MTAVATATAAVPRVYAVNSVPASPTYPYSSYSAAFGRGDTFTNDAAEGVRWGRIVSQHFGRTLASALAHAEQFRAALVGDRLTAGDVTTGPITAELDPAVTRDPDDNGVVGVTTTYTFTATEE